MKKVLVLTLAMVFAFASLAFAAEVGGELKSVVKYKNVNDESTYGGATLDTHKLTVTASEEGVFDASVTLKATDVLTNAEYQAADKVFEESTKGIKLDAYKLAIYDELFTAEVWGREATGSTYATALGFIEAPDDADTVRFTSDAFGPEVVVDFSDKNIRLFGKADVDPVTVGFATNYADGTPDSREYAAFVTTDLSGVTVSGEIFKASRQLKADEDDMKYGVKVTTTVADLGLTGKIVRDTNAVKKDQYTQLYGKVAYDVETVPYGFSVEVDNRQFKNDTDGTKIVLSGDYDVVPEFLNVNAEFTNIRQDVVKENKKGAFVVEDLVRYDDEDGDKAPLTDFWNFDKYNKYTLGATINVTEKLTLKPSYTVHDFENVTATGKKVDNAWDDAEVEVISATDVTYTDIAIDATYAVTDSTSVTYGLTKRNNEVNAVEYEGIYHTLGVSVKF